MKISKYFRYVNNYLYSNFVLPKILNFKYRDILVKNRELKDTGLGKRCFLIGGGPSINEMNLMLLKDEESFVMGEFDQHPLFPKIRPKNYLLIDTAYFTDPDDYFLPQQFIKKSASISPQTRVFVNILAKEFIEKRNLFTDQKIYYLGMQGVMSDKFDFNVDISRVVPFPKNSMLMCLLIAIYMGYREIYLLGCEHNFLSVHIAGDKSLSYGWAYKDARDDMKDTDPNIIKKYLDTRHMHMTYEEQIAHVRQLFKNYRLLYAKVKKLFPEIKIYNATPKSFLDVFPSIRFDEIHFNSKQ